MLYSPDNADERFCYSDATAGGGGVEREFLRVAASYVASPHEGPRSAYYDFFAAHNATLWTVDSATRVATPMQLDVVYTFVNPRAPSFWRNLEARHVRFEQRRYRDWEELRYSLRSLREFVLASDALAQYHHRHAADVRRLGELGYQVNMSDAGAADGVVSLVRRVYLVLSDKDQVPAWLDTERFPELRVVMHADMFSAEEAAWVLPTLNSNVIESGLHRIPGISRFFFYFNNDMIVGRQLSFFDLFRPLSPPRQSLHVYNLSRDSEGSTNASLASNGTGRAALLLEPVLHSDTKYMGAKGEMTSSERMQVMRAREEVRSCMLEQVLPALNSKGRSGEWPAKAVLLPSWATTRVLALPDPHYGVTPRGRGVSSHYYYNLSSIRLEGIGLSFVYAHSPQLVDVEVYRGLNEVELFDFTKTRAAYEGEMHPYSPIDEYAVFEVAMMRGMERQLWTPVWRAAPANAFTDVRDTIESWRAANVLSDSMDAARRVSWRLSSGGADMSMFGALYGDTWGVQLPRPDFAVDLGYWWVRGAVQPVQPVRPSRRLAALKRLYAIPEVGTGDACGSELALWAARGDDHYYSVLYDMFHHTRRDETFLFEMIDSEMRALLLAAFRR
ncbi:hypothetical protein LMJF_23_1120 [Leishmania major strain Friedlin]|uniref:Stealth protein CR2 conserved region 2 domain-containing protein n=1 Tax=Leishmania major TaxID=5664 RepID=Q4QB44_LEIMA|nr:hypothetical protein LMJF_23_1120 [Leishmania major strain Friedlin]CAG9574334.1 hypothetical_protein_-_conserved [Leishmania major strain Friedlin]CAJ04709.1 hypothetical protein LMJF_23_1120 [Leishmania major strain Friedlin]|eukprot:XP_001683454.1 hypothetical protein LMJF_23_1120 [Leishmania major strain Friedlin]